MGVYARVSADVDASIERDAVQDAPVVNSYASAPLSGYVWRNGQAIPFTLETTTVTPRYHNALPEQMIIAALVLVSFIAPVFHLLG